LISLLLRLIILERIIILLTLSELKELLSYPFDLTARHIKAVYANHKVV